MDQKRKITTQGKKTSFAEAEENDVVYYAGINWKESAANAELMRKMIWHKEYEKEMSKVLRKGKLKDDRNDFE